MQISTCCLLNIVIKLQYIAQQEAHLIRKFNPVNTYCCANMVLLVFQIWLQSLQAGSTVFYSAPLWGNMCLNFFHFPALGMGCCLLYCL